MRRHILALLLVMCGSVIMAVQCGGTTAHTQGFPTQHRDTATTCSQTRPPGIVDAGAPSDAGMPCGSCKTDSDCTQGKNGRCMQQGRLCGPACSYDSCFQDSDCSGGSVCLCGATGNRCLTSTCRTDADCSGLGCSPSYDTICGAFDGTQGYYCHTSADECVNDSDCEANGQSGYCAFVPMVGHWSCEHGGICAG